MRFQQGKEVAMSTIEQNRRSDDRSHHELVPVEQRERQSRIGAGIAMAGIAALFVLSVVMAVSQITTGVRAAANGNLHAPLAVPETTGSGHPS